MRNILRFAALGAAVFTQVWAQQGGNAPAIYASTSSYIVPAESRAAYDAIAKDRTRKVAEEWMKEDSAVQGVLLTSVVYGGHTTDQPNYFLTVMTAGLPGPLPEKVGKITQRLYSKSYEEYLKDLHPLRKSVGQSLARRLVAAMGPIADGDYLMIDRKKIAEGRMGDYVEVERQYQKLREAQVKAGKMKAWSMWTMTSPRGTDAAYDAYTVHVGKDLAQVLGWGQGTAEIAASLNPPMNLTGMVMRAQQVSKTVHSDIRRVVFAVTR